MKNAILGLAFFAAMPLFAQQKATVTVHPEQGKQIINKEIYGQFAEHLGTCIYGGLWVGEDSPIPNINGYRKDVFEALKALKVPVLLGREDALPMNITGWTASVRVKNVRAWSTTTGEVPWKTTVSVRTNF